MMIKHKVVVTALALVLVFGFLSPLLAQETSTLNPTGQSMRDGRAWLTYTGPGGMRILALAPFPEEAGKRLEKTVAVISSWPTIRVTELRAESSKGVDDYVLSFSSIQSEGREYSASVPAGLRLRFDGALMYDFRVRSGDYFVRVRGVLMDEASLIAEIVKAVNDPGGYIAERDPSWLALRLEQLDKFTIQLNGRADQLNNRADQQDGRADQLDSRTTEINKRLTQKTDETAALLDGRTLEFEALLETRTRDGEAFIEARSAEFRSLMEAMATDIDTRLEQVQKEATEDREKLGASISANQAQFEKVAEILRLALASEMNKGLFGGPKPLDPAVFDHVMTLKAGNSGTDRVAALESAKAGGLKPKAKEIDIIFRIWFGE
ncbi:MAG: hypothetical protein ABIJ86_16065 [Spirochaetota bacterium]